MQDRKPYPIYQQIEQLRQQLVRSKTTFTKCDLGAGSSAGIAQQRTVGEEAAVVSILPEYGQLLFRLVRHFRPQQVLELGTSLGIGTAYLAAGLSEHARLVTIEGCPETLSLAKQNLQQLQLHQHVDFREGAFGEVLPQVLQELSQPDFIFLDGHHQKEPVLNYFQMLLPHMHEQSVLVVDDIHWSKGMEEAWEELRSHPRASFSLDFFRFGVLIFREHFQHERFNVRL